MRSVRVKPDRRQGATGTSPPASLNLPLVLPPAPQSTGPLSDDDLIEVPYKPKSPEIIDLDLYESPESPQSAKKKKLDILKRGGLEVTTVHGPGSWPVLNPAFQQEIINRAQYLQAYGVQLNGMSPPKVVQGKSIYGSSSPEKTVYGNPKDPFMPPPHVLQGVAPRKVTCAQRTPSADVLDLTIKPTVEIMKVPGIIDQPQNLTSKKMPCVNNETRQINPALEITLVAKNKPPRIPQKRSATGKFMSNKSPMYAGSGIQNVQAISSRNQSTPTKNNANHHSAASSLVIPNYQVSASSVMGNVSPVQNNSIGTNITSSLLQGAGGTILSMASSAAKSPSGMGAIPFTPLLDNPLYMNALYSLTGFSDQHQMALYKELFANRLSGFPGTLAPPGVIATPTSKS